MSERVFLGLGANIGNREGNMRAAVRWLAPSCEVRAVSGLYRSAAVVPEGEAPGPDYLNAACEVATALAPEQLLLYIKQIEQSMGRRPAQRWSPRPIDIDILLYGDRYIKVEGLTLPHPLMQERAFVLLPLAEIAADVAHPVLGRTVGELAARVEAQDVERIAGPEWAAGGASSLD